jgi:quinol monooxygenase YgiN
VSVIVAGTVRVSADNIDRFRPHMEKMLAKSRAEDGCIAYSYAVDVEDAGLIRVFEEWRDEAALQAHFKAAHLAEWRSAWPEFGVTDRQLSLYVTGEKRPA